MPPFERMEELFHDALALPAGERTEWLRARCGEDRELYEQVASLLMHHSLAEAAEKAEEPAHRLDHATAARVIRFGRYETVRILGRGGMGVVYLARRADGEFEQVVALKVIAAPLATDEFIRRFRNERQLLATLTHPNITRLLDGGVSLEGDPFLVMEYIDGERLDRYCDAKRLGIDARLGLFLQLCDAVDFAHRNLILHRDLKPSNALVTGDGTVKLLDFGTAALVPQPDATQYTRAPMLTPRYASPAQLRGERSSVADDVFSLGVILYELLSGAWPFGDPNSKIGELKRAANDSLPAPLDSVATSDAAEYRALVPQALSRLLAGDLSAIAAKALENDPQHRYRTVAELIADIRGYLDGLPIQARPQTLFYRTGKLLRRRWLPVGAAMVFVLGLTVAAGVALREAKTARAETLKAEKINEFLNDMLSSPNDYNFDPKTYTVSQMLEAAVPRIESQWKAEPLVQASLRASVGAGLKAMGNYGAAKQQLQLARAAFHQLGHKDEEARTLLFLGVTATLEGDRNTALGYLRAGLALLNGIGQKAPPLTVVRTKYQLAHILQNGTSSERREAEQLLHEAAELGRRDSSVPRDATALTLAYLSEVMYVEGKTAEAETVAQQALTLSSNEVTKGEIFYDLAHIRARRGDYAGARDYARQMYQVTVHGMGANNVRTAIMKLVWIRYRAETNDLAGVAEQVRETLPAIRAGLSARSANLWVPLRAASRTLNLAGKFTEAEPLAREQLEILDSQHMADDSLRAESLVELAFALAGEKRYGDAAAMYQKAADTFSHVSGGAAAAARAQKKAAELRSR